jgi:hypothetical protein
MLTRTPIVPTVAVSMTALKSFEGRAIADRERGGGGINFALSVSAGLQLKRR